MLWSINKGDENKNWALKTLFQNAPMILYWFCNLNNLVEDLACEINKSGQTDVILLDFSKASDKVKHKRLLLKLDFYGIRDKTKTRTEGLFFKRTQQVVVEGEHSCTESVTSGVPQGSVPGPSLFLIYINDLGDGIRSRVRLFTDDTILYSVLGPPSTSPNDRTT